jgi:hypothetical protein
VAKKKKRSEEEAAKKSGEKERKEKTKPEQRIISEVKWRRRERWGREYETRKKVFTLWM